MAVNDNQIPSGAFAHAATQAVVLLQQGTARAREAASKLIIEQCGARLMRYMKFHGGANDEDAEELMLVTIVNFIDQPCENLETAQAWLLRIARNNLTDWARKRAALKRGEGKTEIQIDEEGFMAILDTQHGHLEVPAWVRTCIQRAAALMQHESPERFTVLQMVFEEWSAEEIAIYFGADASNVSAQQKTAARDRAYRARQTAKEYFEHCKE